MQVSTDVYPQCGLVIPAVQLWYEPVFAASNNVGNCYLL